jgi:bifunctional non-homologous end joining protein LigD
MLAASGSQPETAEGWCTEWKWDGRRDRARRGRPARLVSRRERPITATYPELRHLPELLDARDAGLDGEIVALEEGRPRFGSPRLTPTPSPVIRSHRLCSTTSWATHPLRER